MRFSILYISKKSEWNAQIFFERKERKSWLLLLFFWELCVFWVKSRKWSKNMIFFYQKAESDPRIWYFSTKKQNVVQEYDIFLPKSRKWSKNMLIFHQKVESGPRIWYFSIKKLKALSASDSIFFVIGKALAKVIGFGKLRIDNRKNLTIHQVLSDF